VTIASALSTDAMGLHYILGAFVTGAIMPENLRKPILDRLHGLTLALLMPFFFTLTGLHTFIDLGSPAFLEIFVIATTVAVVGITGGTAVAARLVGEPWPFALGLGALLQTKGLMELCADDSAGCENCLAECVRCPDRHGGRQHGAIDASRPADARAGEPPPAERPAGRTGRPTSGSLLETPPKLRKLRRGKKKTSLAANGTLLTMR
jgi:hypothetical protein